MTMHYYLYAYTCLRSRCLLKKIMELSQHRQLHIGFTGCDLKNYLHGNKPNQILVEREVNKAIKRWMSGFTMIFFFMFGTVQLVLYLS